MFDLRVSINPLESDMLNRTPHRLRDLFSGFRFTRYSLNDCEYIQISSSKENTETLTVKELTPELFQVLEMFPSAEARYNFLVSHTLQAD